MRHPYLKMGLGIYLSYLILGMVNIVLASNMEFLTEKMNVEKTDISLLISTIGIGHLLTINISGKLSDRYGRKQLLIIATFLYVIFLVGIPFTTSFPIAIGLSFIAGVSNSLLDSGSYPALNEAFVRRAGTATVLIKAFVSLGAVILPILIALLISKNLFFGYAFFVPAIVVLVAGFILLKSEFPKNTEDELDNDLVESTTKKNQFAVKPRLMREGIALILIGFTSISLLLIVQTWLPTYAKEVLGFKEIEAISLISFFSIGGLLSVILLAILLNRWIKPVTAMILYPFMGAIFLIIFLINPIQEFTAFLVFCLGLFMSGIFQLTMAVMIELFPENKGTSVAYVSASGSVAFMVIPYGTGLLREYVNVTSVFVFDFILAIVSVLLATYIYKKYKKINDVLR